LQRWALRRRALENAVVTGKYIKKLLTFIFFMNENNFVLAVERLQILKLTVLFEFRMFIMRINILIHTSDHELITTCRQVILIWLFLIQFHRINSFHLLKLKKKYLDTFLDALSILLQWWFANKISVLLFDSRADPADSADSVWASSWLSLFVFSLNFILPTLKQPYQ
jgi:hypothetical protein